VTTDDPLDAAAALIREVGALTQVARRYRDLAASVAEPTFERTVALGSAVRRAGRSIDPDPVVRMAVAELQQLKARCEQALESMRKSEPYLRAAAAFGAGDAARVAALAPELFTAVEPYRPDGDLYWPVSLRSDRAEPHFLAPQECAARIRNLAREGIPAASFPSELGSDDIIQAVHLTDEQDASASPIALAVARGALPGALCIVPETGTVLFYARVLRVPFVVRYTAEVEDEWWRVRPDAYRRYLDELRSALAPGGPVIEGPD
jgi:hypothetical protein